VPPKGHFGFDKTRQHYFLKIGKIDGYHDTYNNPPDKKTIDYTFTLRVVHRPLMSNYWHFEFLIETEHGDLQYNSKWQKLICSSIRDHIQQVAIFSCPN
jgi:hypothetical protein